jgi:predicted permease
MTSLPRTLLPIYLIFALGVVLRKTGLLTRDDAPVMLKTIFYVCLPSLAGYSILNTPLSRAYAVLPFIASAIVFAMFGISWVVTRLLKLSRPTRGTFFVGTLVINVAFMYPIIQGFYGVQGIGKLAMFDAGQGVMAFSFSYFIACLHSPSEGSGHPANGGHVKSALANMLKSPALWAIVIANTLNVLRVPLPVPLKQTLLFLGNGTTPLIMLSMGLLFTPAIAKLPVMLSALAVRMIGGSLLGLLCATLLHLEGDMRMIVILAAAAPAGQSTLTYSALKRLDVELAASLVPISALFGMFYISFLLWLLS